MALALQPEDVADLWPALEPHIARVCKVGGEWSVETVRKRLEAEQAQAWVYVVEGVIQMVLVSEILEKDLYRACNIWLCAGSYSDQARDALLREVEDWARRLGCERVMLIGRRGWEKKMPAYRRTRVILEKRL
jgi:hypothetical protein